jgi:hypothetical protein
MLFSTILVFNTAGVAVNPKTTTTDVTVAIGI